MKKKTIFIGAALLMCSQLSYAAVIIQGGINGNTGSGSANSIDVGINYGVNGNSSNGGKGGNGIGLIVGGPNGSVQQAGASSSQLTKDIYSSICASPFMKKYASICQ